MSRPGDRPRWSRGIPKGADPEEARQRASADRLAAKVERNLEADRARAAERAARRRRGAKLSPDEESFDVGHELRDMRLRSVIKWLGLLTVAVTLLVVGITVFEAGILGGIGPLRMVIDEPPRVTPPAEPRLERTNGEVLRALRTREDRVLNNYMWIDQAAGKVSLPIDRALELTLQRGLPVRAQSGQTGATGTVTGTLSSSTLPQGSSSGRTLETIP